jgi:hypothetical protein
VSLTNSGNAALNVGTIQITGDFAQVNNCQTTLAANASCAINVTFTPTASGTRNGILTVNDSAAGGMQTADLSGGGPDFSLTSAPGSVSVAPGATASYNLTISPVGGSFASEVKLACSGLPAQASCSLSPNAVTPGANPAGSTLSITTAASVAAARALRPSRGVPMLAVWIQLQGIGLLGIILALPKRHGKQLRGRALLLLLIGFLIFMTACAGGTGIAPAPQTGTTPGTYTVTVTGSSGSLQHSLSVTLTVK